MDVKDILEVEKETGSPQLSKEVLMGMIKDPSKKTKKVDPNLKMARPTGMNREVYALLYADSNNSSSLVPTDTGSGYRQPKARLGRKHVRPWKWMSFSNLARKDNLVLHHWRRVADEGKDYPYAKFNKQLEIPTYTPEEYTTILQEPGWTKEETDHLMDLCRQFDLRFVVILDRYDNTKYPKRSVEDLKERYYSIHNRMAKKANPNIEESSLMPFDAGHETKRKVQLERLLNRTKEQVEEEEILISELKKIELRKKEREKKQKDLQKLISAAEQNSESRKTQKKSTFKKMKTVGTSGIPGNPKPASEGTMVFKTYDKSSGISLRSSKLKFPLTLGQKKTKTVEQILEELGVDIRPMATEQVCVQFNDLRNDLFLLLELKAACDACEFELQSLKHRYQALPYNKQVKIHLPAEMSPSTPKKSSLQIMEVVSQGTQAQRKRRTTTLEAALKRKKL